MRQEALSDAGDDAEKATHLLINRLLHGPYRAMREIATRNKALHGDGAVEEWESTEQVLRRLFGLDQKE